LKRIFTQPYNSIHNTQLWAKVGLTSKGRGPFIGSFKPPQRSPQTVVTEKGPLLPVA
jgi:hypothetical protein